MIRNIAILHQGFIPEYRVRFYELLNSSSHNRYTVFHGKPIKNSGHKPYAGEIHFPNVRVNNIEVSFFGKSIIYQPVLFRVLTGKYSACVLGLEVKFMANLLLFAFFKISGKPVLWWGHGFDKEEDTSGRILSRLARFIKNRLASYATGYIAYTEGGKQRMIDLGMPADKITVVHNTLDMEESIRHYEAVEHVGEEHIRKRLGLSSESIVMIYIGRIYKEKRIDHLLELVYQLHSSALTRRPVELIIIGNGPDWKRVKSLYPEMVGIHYWGEVYDQNRIAEAMKVSSATLFPGKVGLAVNHSFAFGKPIITRESPYHAPEIEYVKNGYNGLVVPGDFTDFVNAVAGFVNSSDLQQELVDGALKTRKNLSLQTMVSSFDYAVKKALGDFK